MLRLKEPHVGKMACYDLQKHGCTRNSGLRCQLDGGRKAVSMAEGECRINNCKREG